MTHLVQRHHKTAATSDCASEESPAPSHAPTPPAPGWCHHPDLPADNPHQSRQSATPTVRSPPQSPPLPPYEPTSHARPPLGVTRRSAPFCPADGLTAAYRARAVLMHFDVAVINHQSLKIKVIGHGSQQFGLLGVLLPAPETVCGSVPVPVVGRQVEPGSAGAEDPERGVDESAVILGGAYHFAGAAGVVWSDGFLGVVGDVMTAAGWRGGDHRMQPCGRH